MNVLALNQTTNGAGNQGAKSMPWSAANAKQQCFQAAVTGTGAVTATIAIQVSLDGGVVYPFFTLGTITLSGTNSASDAFVSIGLWPFAQCVLSNVTGTGATVNCAMGDI